LLIYGNHQKLHPTLHKMTDWQFY